jgi:hypothetical protein
MKIIKKLDGDCCQSNYSNTYKDTFTVETNNGSLELCLECWNKVCNLIGMCKDNNLNNIEFE